MENKTLNPRDDGIVHINVYSNSELPPLSPTCLKWGLLISLRLKAIPAVPAVLGFILLFKLY